MKVSELISKLKGQNQNAIVLFDNGRLDGMRILPSVDVITNETLTLYHNGNQGVATDCVLLKRVFDTYGNPEATTELPENG